MSWNKTFLLSLVSAILSAAACLIYLEIYKRAFFIDFGEIIGAPSIISACAIGCFLMATGYTVALKWKGERAIGWLNILYSVLSFASIAGVLGYTLPLEMESPEMFPGLAIPMHFFPVLALLTIYPFFKTTNTN